MTTYQKIKAAITSIQTLANVPCYYAASKTRSAPPYIVYLGTGQNTFEADDTYFWKDNTYQVEYYFTEKNEDTETAIENALLDSGFLYTKSEDIAIENENVFVIYYNI